MPEIAQAIVKPPRRGLSRTPRMLPADLWRKLCLEHLDPPALLALAAAAPALRKVVRDLPCWPGVLRLLVRDTEVVKRKSTFYHENLGRTLRAWSHAGDVDKDMIHAAVGERDTDESDEDQCNNWDEFCAPEWRVSFTVDAVIGSAGKNEMVKVLKTTIPLSAISMMSNQSSTTATVTADSASSFAFDAVWQIKRIFSAAAFDELCSTGNLISVSEPSPAFVRLDPSRLRFLYSATPSILAALHTAAVPAGGRILESAPLARAVFANLAASSCAKPLSLQVVYAAIRDIAATAADRSETAERRRVALLDAAAARSIVVPQMYRHCSESLFMFSPVDACGNTCLAEIEAGTSRQLELAFSRLQRDQLVICSDIREERLRERLQERGITHHSQSYLGRAYILRNSSSLDETVEEIIRFHNPFEHTSDEAAKACAVGELRQLDRANPVSMYANRHECYDDAFDQTVEAQPLQMRCVVSQ
jgi:hypothetical protein